MAPEKRKKKVVIYSLLMSGCLNISASFATLLLDKYPDEIEIWFITDEFWKTWLEKRDKRYKYGVFHYDSDDSAKWLAECVDKTELQLTMEDCVEKAQLMWTLFIKNPGQTEVDEKAEIEIKKIKPDFLLCDQAWMQPAMVNAGCPYAFIISQSPGILSFDGIPKMTSDAREGELDKVKQFDERMEPFWADIRNYMDEYFKKRNTKYDGVIIPTRATGDNFVIYMYPEDEVGYFNEELKKKYNLYQIDSPLFPARIPKPYVLPESFAALPGKIVYLSLGSLFSAYTHRLQEIVDALEKIPDYKYIVSKGPRGEGLVFPSNRFIGENYIDQLGVLQVIAQCGGAMISHGGNNSTCEAFYFGIPMVIFPCMGDQINNAVRLEEKGYGEQMSLLNVNADELKTKLDRLINDQELRAKWKKASERIQRENRLGQVADHIAEFVKKL